nr:NUMOD4 domain-containing protein [Robbsia andropogonis]
MALNGDSDVWRPIARYAGKYEVSSNGAIRNARSGAFIAKRINSRGGYYTVFLWVDGKSVGQNVHRLVAETFIPNPDALPCVNHINGEYLDNAVQNLEWCTHKQNTGHAIHVLKRDFPAKLKCGKGMESGSHKLVDEEVRDIKKRLREGETCVSIGIRFSVSPSTISWIKRGRTWSHIQ